MALKNVATESCTISHAPGSTTSGGSFSIVTPPSLKVKAEASGVYSGPTSVSFSGGNSSLTVVGEVPGAITPGTVMGSATINPTAVKVKAGGSEMIRVDDSASFSTLTGTFVPSAPPNTPVPGTSIPLTDIEVSNAGQTKVRAE